MRKSCSRSISLPQGLKAGDDAAHSPGTFPNVYRQARPKVHKTEANMRRLFKNLSLSSLAAISGACLLAPTVSAESGRAVGSRIVVEHFAPAVRSHGEKFYLVAFSYSFPHTSKLSIRGVGAVPSSGNLEYLTQSTKLTFEDERGATLVVKDLKISGTPEGAGIELPGTDDFPAAFKSFTIAKPLSLDRSNAVLNGFFDGGYTVRSEQGKTFEMTAYQALKGVPANKVADFAVQVSSPYDVSAHQSAFHVQLIVRERGIKSDTWLTSVSAETLRSAAANRDKIAAQLAK